MRQCIAVMMNVLAEPISAASPGSRCRARSFTLSRTLSGERRAHSRESGAHERSDAEELSAIRVPTEDDASGG